VVIVVRLRIDPRSNLRLPAWWQGLAAIKVQLETGWKFLSHDVIDVRMGLVEVQRSAAVSLELETGWESSGYDVIDVRMEHVRVQFLASVTLELPARRECINKSFFLSRESIVNLHELV
jgi:hypothetical protein